MLTTDGPYSKTKEVAGGYSVLEARSGNATPPTAAPTTADGCRRATVAKSRFRQIARSLFSVPKTTDDEQVLHVSAEGKVVR